MKGQIKERRTGSRVASGIAYGLVNDVLKVGANHLCVSVTDNWRNSIWFLYGELGEIIYSAYGEKSEAPFYVLMRMKKMFLKKTTTDQISQSDLNIGNTITLYSRVLNILDFGDEVTRYNFAQAGSMDQMGTILTDIHQAGFTLARIKMVHLNELQVGQFYTNLRGEPFYPDLGEVFYNQLFHLISISFVKS